MLFFPDSPRWLLMQERDDEALDTLCKLRRKSSRDDPELVTEYLEIKAQIMLENSFAKERWPHLSGLRLDAAQYLSLFSDWARFRRLAIGCIVMFFQQFMGCNGMFVLF
jgi:Sugar (and other) transporter